MSDKLTEAAVDDLVERLLTMQCTCPACQNWDGPKVEPL